ncbi:hypothetical protein SCP_0100450 [Sparassis crispa]|uniref:Uncharacterized protein n=1 Tax=Sparassis crispa TaxID=139825 RepID=A0A401G4T6_9APHY|nr:hypothetical protein SCP_0100450 [Sparassis crispa]GBE77173.1 hypothetical protein SCP_0100450 [Sparassis crispa]
MAEEDDFPVVMTSILRQRQVWTLTVPIIGVAYSKTGTYVHFYCGWLENDAASENVLLPVHIGSLGPDAFLDLALPHEALVLSRFILTLQGLLSRVTTIVKETVPHLVEDICRDCVPLWRLDTSLIPDSVVTGEDCFHRILSWTEALGYKYEDDKSQGSSHGKSREPVKNATRQGSLGSAKSTSSQQRKLPGNATDVHHDTSSDQKLETRAKPFMLATKAMSCSEFAGNAAKDEQSNIMFDYMFDRHATPRPIWFNPVVAETCKEFLGPMWPKNWKTVGDLPFADEYLSSYKDELLHEVDTLGMDWPDVPEEILPLLRGHFSTILRATMYQQRYAASVIPVPEVSWRADFDCLFRDFFTSAIAGQPSLFTERANVVRDLQPLRVAAIETMIALPRSLALDYHGTNAARYSRHVQEVPERYFDELYRLSEEKRAEETTNRHQVEAHVVRWESRQTLQDLLTRFSDSPLRGKCDGLGVLQVDLPVKRILLNKFQLAAVAKPKAKKDVASHFPFHRPQTADGPAAHARVLDLRREGSRNVASSSASQKTPSTDKLYDESPGNRLKQEMRKMHARRQCLTSGQSSKAKNPKVGPASILQLPVFSLEYKKDHTDIAKGHNQTRMYSAALLRFLEAAGIIKYPVFAGTTDGPVINLSAAWTDDNRVELFERQAERINLTVAIGSWHYATVLARLAMLHAKTLYEKFNTPEIKDKLVEKLNSESLGIENDVTLRWRLDHQLAELLGDGVVKRRQRNGKTQVGEAQRKRPDVGEGGEEEAKREEKQWEEEEEDEEEEAEEEDELDTEDYVWDADSLKDARGP